MLFFHIQLIPTKLIKTLCHKETVSQEKLADYDFIDEVFIKLLRRTCSRYRVLLQLWTVDIVRTVDWCAIVLVQEQISIRVLQQVKLS